MVHESCLRRPGPDSVEMGAVTVIVLASVVQGFFLYRLVPELASLYASSGEGLSLRLRLYIGFCNWFLILAPVVLAVWMGFPDRRTSVACGHPPEGLDRGGCPRRTGHDRGALFHG